MNYKVNYPITASSFGGFKAVGCKFYFSVYGSTTVINYINSQSHTVEGEGQVNAASTTAALFDAAIVDLTELPNKKKG